MSELKLNIYNKKEVVKTYEAETYDLMFGTVEDLINVVDLDNIDLNDNTSIVKAAGKVVVSGMDILKPLYKDIFDGLTDEELRHTRLTDLSFILVEVIKFAITEMMKGATGKN